MGTQTLDSVTPSWELPSTALPICSTDISGDCRQSTELEKQASPRKAPKSDSQPMLGLRPPPPTMTLQRSSWALGCQLESRQTLQTLEFTLTLRWMLPTEEDCSCPTSRPATSATST